MSNPALGRSKRQILGLLEFCRLGGLQFHLLGASMILLGIAAVFEGFSFGALVPFLKQAAGMGPYEGWRNIPVVGNLLSAVHFEQAYKRVDLLLGIIVIAVFIRQCAAYVSQILYCVATQSFEVRLRIVGYKRILNYGCLFFDSVKKGEIHNTLMRFTAEVADLMRTLFDLTRNILFGTIYLITLLAISSQLCLISIAVTPLFYWLVQKLFKKIHALYTSVLNTEQKGYGLSLDVFSNIKLVKAMSREYDEARSFESNEHLRNRHSILAYSLYLLISPLQEILLTIGIAIILWMSLTIYFRDDPAFLVKLIVAVLIFRRAMQVVNYSLSLFPLVIRRIPFVRELRKLLNQRDKSVISCGNHILRKVTKGIEYRGLEMAYVPKGEPSLKNISFFIPAGSFTAIVGASGAGKTTLVELLPRFYEYQGGDILIDDISIRDYDLTSLRNAIGFVSQDTLVLNDTLYNNILYAKPNASSDEIQVAANKAYVTVFASKLTEGLNTVIGDKGVKLSGGELQRLAIARVILRQPMILILDEATCSLDSQSEQLIQHSLNELSADRSTIAIAHRLSTIQHADQIIVFEQGRIAETGKSQDLIAKQGAFYQYWNAQKIQS